MSARVFYRDCYKRGLNLYFMCVCMLIFSFSFSETGTLSPISNVLSRVDGLVSITCNPPSNAKPPIKNITWQQGDNPLPSDSRFKVIGNTLQIEKAQRADTGTYKCIAENIAGKTSVDVRVLVAGKSIFLIISVSTVEVFLQSFCKHRSEIKLVTSLGAIY